jgi:hypothetical protein
MKRRPTAICRTDARCAFRVSLFRVAQLSNRAADPPETWRCEGAALHDFQYLLQSRPLYSRRYFWRASGKPEHLPFSVPKADEAVPAMPPVYKVNKTSPLLTGLLIHVAITQEVSVFVASEFCLTGLPNSE